MKLSRCRCGRVKGASATRCRHCQAGGPIKAIGRPRGTGEVAAAIERKLAVIDALKRRARWAA